MTSARSRLGRVRLLLVGQEREKAEELRTDYKIQKRDDRRTGSCLWVMLHLPLWMFNCRYGREWGVAERSSSSYWVRRGS
jgi:hypothetical protein